MFPVNNQKGLVGLALIVVVVILLGGVAGYFTFFRTSPTSLPTQATTEKSNDELAGWLKYTDPQNRFSFSYPPAFGKPSQGTNSGFGDRVAAIRFSKFSSGVQAGKGILGGEATLTKGFVMVDMQALGGLYDSITLEVFPDAMRNNILGNISALNVTNFCGEMAKTSHIDFNSPAFASLSQQQKGAIPGVDQMRNIDPKVISCEVSGDTVTFYKEATFESGQARGRQNIYGAIRFLDAPFSSFQLIRSTNEAPDAGMLNTMTAVVKSFNQ